MFLLMIKKQNFRKWEWALLLSLLFTLALGACWPEEQESIQSKVTRLHVLANSDSEEDQALKLKVRDGVLEEAKNWEGKPMDAAFFSAIQKAAQKVVEQEGYHYPVQVERRVRGQRDPTRLWMGLRGFGHDDAVMADFVLLNDPTADTDGAVNCTMALVDFMRYFTGKAIALRPKQREAEADRPRRLRCDLHAGTQPGVYYFERRGEPADLPEDFSGWIACAPHDGVAHATTAHRTFLRCTRTEDGGVQFPPELLAAGGRCSVYAVDQTGTMRVAEVRLPKPKPVPASTEPKANGQTGDAPAQP